MYLGILVLSCAVFNLVHVNGRTIQCPECSGWGKNASDSCDSHYKFKNCTFKKPICMIQKNVFPTHERVTRMCSSQESYDGFENNCKISRRVKSCPKISRGYCTTSRCFATLLEPETESKPFSCPFCEVFDTENKIDGLNKCKATVVDKECPSYEKAPLVCMTYSEYGVFRRKCISKQRYEILAAGCEQRENCLMTMCETSGCNSSEPEKSKPFTCPFCEVFDAENKIDGLNKCKATVVDKECPSYEKAPLVCMTYSEDDVFRRKCISKQRYEILAAGCEQRENCLMTTCETSGCEASPEPEKSKLFICPFCEVFDAENKTDGLNKCKAAVVDKECPSYEKAPLVCMTYSEDDVFRRKCISKHRYEILAAVCERRENCLMTMCKTSGCNSSV